MRMRSLMIDHMYLQLFFLFLFSFACHRQQASSASIISKHGQQAVRSGFNSIREDIVCTWVSSDSSVVDW